MLKKMMGRAAAVGGLAGAPKPAAKAAMPGRSAVAGPLGNVLNKAPAGGRKGITPVRKGPATR